TPRRFFAAVASTFMATDMERLRTTLPQISRLNGYDLANRPPQIAQALLISAEDHRYFSHLGVDPIAVCRAIWRRLTVGKKEGASTIEMQVVRVLTGRFERTLFRKIREMLLASIVTYYVPKRALPAIYLRIAYYGTGMHGFAAACRRLRIDPLSMNAYQAAGLIARLKYPQPRVLHDARCRQIEARIRYILAVYSYRCSSDIHSALSENQTRATISPTRVTSQSA